MEAKGQEPDREPCEPGGRRHQLIEKMSTDDLAAAYGDGTRFRSHGPSYAMLDEYLARWLKMARDELAKREQLDTIKEWLPVYFDPSRNPPVFGPGAPLVSQGAIEKAVAPRAALRAAG